MLGKSLNDLNKYYNGKPHRVMNPHLESLPSQNSFSNKLSYLDTKLNQQNNNQQKNMNDRKLESSTPKKLNEDSTKSLPNSNYNNYTNINHQQQKKFIDTLNDKNMCKKNFFFYLVLD